MNNITADHLARRACVYVRQSTPGQVQNNLESQRRQYALVDRARSLGWQDIDVIDDDLGISGSGTHRPGFERLLPPQSPRSMYLTPHLRREPLILLALRTAVLVTSLAARIPL